MSIEEDEQHNTIIYFPMHIMVNHTIVGLECTQVAQKNPSEQLTNWVDSDALKWVIL